MVKSVQAKVILHFDVNGTLMLKDTSKEIKDDDALIYALAENTIDQWDARSEKQSFKDYVYTVLLPGKKGDQQLKKIRQAAVCNFVNWMEEKRHPALERVKAIFDKVQAKFADPVSRSVHYTVFPSFFVLLERLRESKVPFSIVLRTFGGDLPEITEEIAKHPSGVTFTRWGKFEGRELYLEGEKTARKAEAVFDTFLKSDEHFAINDDWQKWIQDEGRARSGKPFIYDAQGNKDGVKNLSLFFDDNITYDAEKDIVYPIEIGGQKEPEKSLLFEVNTIDAMLDDNYFADRVIYPINLKNWFLTASSSQ